MGVRATCDCGQEFNIAEATLPRPVNCHTCGRKWLVTEAGERVPAPATTPTAPQAFRPHPQISIWGTTPGGSQSARRSRGGEGGIHCKCCDAVPKLVCKACSELVCQDHCVRTAFGTVCVDCYDQRRPLMVFGAIIAAAAGVFTLVITSDSRLWPPEWWIVWSIRAGLCSALWLSRYMLWSAFRRIP